MAVPSIHITFIQLRPPPGAVCLHILNMKSATYGVFLCVGLGTTETLRLGLYVRICVSQNDSA